MNNKEKIAQFKEDIKYLNPKIKTAFLPIIEVVESLLPADEKVGDSFKVSVKDDFKEVVDSSTVDHEAEKAKAELKAAEDEVKNAPESKYVEIEEPKPEKVKHKIVTYKDGELVEIEEK